MFSAIECWLERDERANAQVDPVFPMLASLMVFVGALWRFRQHEAMFRQIEDSPWRDTVRVIGDPSLFIWSLGVAFVAAGVTLALVFPNRASALVLFVARVPVTSAIQVAPEPEHEGSLFKNVAILAAPLLFRALDPGAHTLNGNGRQQPSGAS